MFKEVPITPTDLVEWGTFSPLSIAFLWLAVENGKSCIFAGGTASGKTTSLNAISLFIPPLAKIVTHGRYQGTETAACKLDPECNP